jgi:putative isomerase
MQKKYFLLLAAFFTHTCLYAQTTHREIKTVEYKNLQHKLSQGWNTWYNNSVISHVLLPENFAINLCVANKSSPEYIKETFKASDILKRPEKVDLGLRSDDGSYTSMRLFYKGKEIMIQTANDGNDELILVTPMQESPDYLVVEAGLLWNSEGFIGMKGNMLIGKFDKKTITVRSTTSPIQDGYTVTTAPRLTFSLKNEIGIFTGQTRTLSAIKTFIAKSRAKQQKRVDSYGDLSASFKAMQTILAWNTIYDAPNHRVITPVSRMWSYRWGAGYVLFDWDTYFASYMMATFNKDLAYANAIEITKAITPGGFIPNYQSISRGSSIDRSQPPIGSTIILNIYKKYPEKWFLTEVYDELLTWNRWWIKNRLDKGYLAWGEYNFSDTLTGIKAGVLEQAAKYESGLDNSPMYDKVPFNLKTHTMEMGDVGLMSMYVMDCNSLAEIATILGKTADANELNKRSAVYKQQLNTLWDEKTGIFLNKRLDNNELSYRLSPTNFYPMLANACTQQQAERMMKDHYYNPNEFYGEYGIPSIMKNDPAFKDNNYWRGRIWGPLNFLVYMGMKNYDVKPARTDLIERSRKLFLKSWEKDGSIYENYNSVTGAGDDVVNADGFYHWGALLTFMEFIEKGYMNPSK